MSSIPAKDWAYFIVEKLGFDYPKSTITRYAEIATDREVWDHFIGRNPVYLKAAQFNRIDGPSDVAAFFRDRSYANMRSTFPSKSRGRSIIGTHRILTLKQIKEQERAEEERLAAFRRTHLDSENSGYKFLPRNLIGRRIKHVGPTLSFGEGSIIDIINGKALIVVKFEDGTVRKLNYYDCIKKGFIEFI